MHRTRRVAFSILPSRHFMSCHVSLSFDVVVTLILTCRCLPARNLHISSSCLSLFMSFLMPLPLSSASISLATPDLYQPPVSLVVFHSSHDLAWCARAATHVFNRYMAAGTPRARLAPGRAVQQFLNCLLGGKGVSDGRVRALLVPHLGGKNAE